jgi:hypothetical protein
MIRQVHEAPEPTEGGKGVSVPRPGCTFHDLRGKRA